ncbi:hypothetical protein V1508DRAFT_403941 [Lipomyces doorenjongii]|uniref:uncharacterized protein n=1 Tax=Lipomyces doorenjongii TaxID=383834 RepID=UPI0034CEFD3F
MPAVSASDMFLEKDKNSSSDYDEALFLLENNLPEQRLDIPLPYSQYLKLEEISEERRYPSLSYNILMLIATVMIASSVNTYLSIHEPRAIHRIKNYSSTTMKDLGPYGKTTKEPDQSFGYWRPGLRPQLQVAIECGVSENYDALCRDKDLWIQHLGAKVVILICLKEVPHYRSPRTANESIEDPVAEVEKMEQYVAEAMAKNLEQGNYGPIEYRSHTWLGKLDEVFLEVWRADGQQPVRKRFFPENEWAACKFPESNVRFLGGRYLLEDIVGAMQLTARSRFVDFLGSVRA